MGSVDKSGTKLIESSRGRDGWLSTIATRGEVKVNGGERGGGEEFGKEMV